MSKDYASKAEVRRASQLLFSGEILIGRLSNENQLVKTCPKHFRTEWLTDEWCKTAQDMFFKGSDTSKWAWKTNDKEERSKQIQCLHLTLSSYDQQHEDKIAVAGWMLSEMLTEVPSN